MLSVSESRKESEGSFFTLTLYRPANKVFCCFIQGDILFIISEISLSPKE